MKNVILVAAFFSFITNAYAGNGSLTPLLNGQTWFLEKVPGNSASCAARIDTSVEPPSTQDEYFVAYNDVYNAGSAGYLEVWPMQPTSYALSHEVHVAEVAENKITLRIYVEDYPQNRLMKSKSLQAKFDINKNPLTMHAQQMDASDKITESCEYLAYPLN